MKIDEVCEKYSEESVGLSIRLLSSDMEGEEFVLISGSSKALKFMSELLAAAAEDNVESGFQISPDGAGRFQLSEESNIGFYINRTS
ncbi:hypothetical protein LL973_08140 [Xanthomonas campestris pv. nigromaculans]|nr:hypothetical protein [Xanthomonas campestris pv. nigromaculans]